MCCRRRVRRSPPMTARSSTCRLRVGQLAAHWRASRGRSMHELALREGQHVYALIKAVSLDRRSVGYA